MKPDEVLATFGKAVGKSNGINARAACDRPIAPGGGSQTQNCGFLCEADYRLDVKWLYPLFPEIV